VIEFARPWLLLVLVPLGVSVWWRRRGRPQPEALRHARLALLPDGGGWRVRLRRLMPWLAALALALMVVALAGPRIAHLSEEIEGEGIDIVVALDISGSMRALDFEPEDRLGAAKRVIRDFVAGRPHDSVGLVLFAAKAFTQCPLTLDHRVLLAFLEEVEVGMIDDGTAIGLGLATAVNRLKDSAAESKVVILLTDGLNNDSTLEPETAAELARTLGIRVYTVAIGREGVAPYPVDDPIFGRRTRPMETKIDERLLREIATATGGETFRATDPEALSGIFATIDRLETTRYETLVSTYHRELMGWFAGPALLLLLVEALLCATLLRRLP
jgi:Ca-activated chloride channel family protein